MSLFSVLRVRSAPKLAAVLIEEKELHMSKIATKGWRYSRCGPIGTTLKLESFDLPVGKDDVVVKMLYAPLHRVDSAIVNGSVLGRNKIIGHKGFPRIGGSEGVGTVVRSGNSKSVKEGDTVWVAPLQGTWAETISCDAQLVHRIDPKHALLATTASNFVLAQQLLSGVKGGCVVQNGGSSLTALAVAALAQDINTTVFSAASKGERFSQSQSRLKQVNSQLFEYSPSGARAMKSALNGIDVRLLLNAVGGNSFNDFVKLVGSNGHIVSFGAQNSYGLMWAGSNQIFKQLTFRGFFLPRYLSETQYEVRQANLDSAIRSLSSKGFKYPTEQVKLDALPQVWDKSFVKGGSKGIIKF
jgi:NADPH:quinone reductase-like Zn-dependent oxidoreductase